MRDKSAEPDSSVLQAGSVTHAPVQLGGVSQRAEQLRVALEKRHHGRVWNLPRGERKIQAQGSRARDG
jgi:hypothetical protein